MTCCHSTKPALARCCLVYFFGFYCCCVSGLSVSKPNRHELKGLSVAMLIFIMGRGNVSQQFLYIICMLLHC